VAVNRTKVLEAAQKFLSKGQYDKAIAEYQKLVTEDPRDVRTLLKIGDLHTRRNKPKDAIDVYQKVAELYAKQGFFLKAVAVYKQILKLDATHIDSSQKLAKMYEELALTSDALSTYEQVADAYVAQGQVPKAIETMQRMVDLDPQNIAVRIKYAEALSKAERAKDAAKAFAEGAALLKEQGRIDDYIRVVERQLYHDADNLDIARELSSMYLERSDPKRALAKLQICFKADPRDVQTLEMLAEAFRQLGQIPKTVSVLKEISRLHAEVGAHEPRKRTLKRILDLDPTDQEARQGLAQAGGPAPAAAPAAAAAKPANANAGAQAARPAPAQPQPTSPARPAPQPQPDDDDDFDLEVESGESGTDDDDDFMAISEPPPEPRPAPRPAGGGPRPSTQQQQPVVRSPEPAPRAAAPSVQQPKPAPAAAPAPEPKLDPAAARAAKIARMLEEADKQEGAGRYEAAEALLKQVLDMDDEHLPSHERLKDLYLATDRRVEAVRELLWLAEAWGIKNRERAVQYAKAAFDLAPNAASTRATLRALGVDPDLHKQEEVMFVDDSRATELARGEDTGDASLDAILPPMSEPPAARGAAARAQSNGRLERVTRGTMDRPAQEDPLDIPLSPDDFDAPPPEPLRTITKSSVQALLERPIMPEEFELEPEPAPRAPIPGSAPGAYGASAGQIQAPQAKISSVMRQPQDTGPLYPSRPPLESARPAGRAADVGGKVESDYDDMQALLDAPISPDEFDAPPPRRETGTGSARVNMSALLDQPLPPDDFGLSDERFERSGLIDVEEPPKPSVRPAAASTVPPGKAMRAQLLEREDDDDEPSIEFAEINTGEVDVAAEAEAEMDDAAGSTMVEDGLAEQLADAQQRATGEFADLGTGEIVTIQSDVPPPPRPPPFQPKVPAGTQLKVDIKPPVPAPPAGAFKAKPSAPASPQRASRDETDWSDLDFDAQPEPTVRGEPIPELVRQSMRQSPDLLTPAGMPVVESRQQDEVDDLFVVPESLPPPAPATPQPREEPTATLTVGVENFEEHTEEVNFTAPPPSVANQPVAEALPAELEEVLDEAEFFSSQGMHDEALEAIQEAILIYPKFKVLKDKLAEYETKADAKEAQEEAKAEQIEDDSFDIAQQLATELAEPSAEAAGQEMVDVESVFAQFKKGVAQQISVDDSDTHFDLGIAYKEMGLIEDAIQEFETASLGPSRSCTALTMVGMCYLEKGDVPGAVAQFERALASKVKSAAEELALYYELGNGYELMGQLDRAAACFEKVAQRDRTFRGVTARLEQLKKRGTKSAGAIG
jgi:tetratricopeptide (TPR) repeat protein